jgi:hypothetical protein
LTPPAARHYDTKHAAQPWCGGLAAALADVLAPDTAGE